MKNDHRARLIGQLTLLCGMLCLSPLHASSPALYLFSIENLQDPYGIIVDPTGNVFIAAPGKVHNVTGGVQKWFNGDISTIVRHAFNLPFGIEADAKGDLYISYVGNPKAKGSNAVKKWTAATGKLSTLIDTGLDHPYAVAVDSSGNVYIADTANNKVKKWSEGKLSTIVSGLNHPVGIAADTNGDLYIADRDNNAVKKWSAATGQLSILVSHDTTLGHPRAVHVDHIGDVYIAGSKTVQKWSAATGQLSTLVSAGHNLTNPSDLAVDSTQDILYVTDTKNDAVRAFWLGWDNWVNHVKDTPTETPVLYDLFLSHTDLQLARPGMPAQTLELSPGYRLNVRKLLRIGKGKTLALNGGALAFKKKKPVLEMDGGTLSVLSGAYDVSTYAIRLSGSETVNVEPEGTLQLPSLTLKETLTKSGKGALILGSAGLNVDDQALQISGGSIEGGTIALVGGTLEDIALRGDTSISSDIPLRDSPPDHPSTFGVRNPDETMTLFGDVMGTGSFIKTGLGTLILKGRAGYQGNTAIAGGILEYDKNPGGAGTITLRADGSSSAELDLKLAPGSVFSHDLILDSTTGSAIFKNIAPDLLTLTRPISLTGLHATIDGGTGGIDLTGSAISGGYEARGNLSIPLPQGPLTVSHGYVSVLPGTLSVPVTLDPESVLTARAPSDPLVLTDITFNGGTLGEGAFSLDSAMVKTAVDTVVSSGFKLDGSTSFVMGSSAGSSPKLTLSGNISGAGGVVVSGPGMMIMSGDNTYRGDTNIPSGWLHLEGSLKSRVIVGDKGTFSGGGVVTGDVINAGTVQPSILQNGVFEPGTLVVNGAYKQTGTLAVLMGTYAGGVRSSLLDVNGAVTLNAGSTVSFLKAGSGLDHLDPTLEGSTFSILRSSGSIDGFFTKGLVDASSIPGFNFSVVGPRPRTDNMPGQEILVILYPSLEATTTSSSVTLAPTVVNQSTAIISGQIRKRQDGLSETIGKSGSGKGDSLIALTSRSYIPGHSTKAGSLFLNSSGQRYQAPQGWNNLFSILDQAGSLDFSKDEAESGKLDQIFWVAPVYSYGKNKKTASAGASTDHMQLLLAGIEWQNPQSEHLFGFSLGGGFGEAKSSVLRGNKSDHKTIQSVLYNSMRWDAIRWDAYLTANRMFSHNDRVANASLGTILKSKNITDTLGASTEVSYKANFGDLLIVRPYYGVDYWHIMAHGYREKSDSIYAQAHARMVGHGFDHYIGATIRKTWTGIGDYALRVEGDLYYSYTLKDPKLIDRVSATDGNALIRSTALGGCGKGTFGPSLTLSAMDQERGTKYFLNGSTTIQNNRTAYQFILKAAVPLN